MIQLQFVSEDSIGAKLIRDYSHGWPSHVDAVLPDGTLLGSQGFKYGDIAPGVQIRPANYAQWTQARLVQLYAPDAEAAAFYAFLKAQVGQPYNWPGIFAFALGMDVVEHGEWFCSELIAAALVECGYWPRQLSKPPEELTPADVLLVVSPYDMAGPVGKVAA